MIIAYLLVAAMTFTMALAHPTEREEMKFDLPTELLPPPIEPLHWVSIYENFTHMPIFSIFNELIYTYSSIGTKGMYHRRMCATRCLRCY